MHFHCLDLWEMGWVLVKWDKNLEFLGFLECLVDREDLVDLKQKHNHITQKNKL